MAESSSCLTTILHRYERDPDMLIPMMQDLQAERGYLPQADLAELSRGLQVPLTRLYSVATFYASFRLVPQGEHTIQLCMGTVCFLKGAGKIAEAIQEEFHVAPRKTSPDGKFTFAPVNCLGACALAPVMVVDHEYYGGLEVRSALKLLHQIGEQGVVPAAGPAASPRPKPRPVKEEP